MELKAIPEDKIWKYARPELERRFLLKARPAELDNHPAKDLTDKYLSQSNLRLRKTFDGTVHVYKLTKKLPVNPNRKEIHWITTVYLSQPEYTLLMEIPGTVLMKRRYTIPSGSGQKIALDEIRLHKEIIWIAEVEFDNQPEMQTYRLPLDYAMEVTNEVNFSGSEIAKRWSA